MSTEWLNEIFKASPLFYSYGWFHEADCTTWWENRSWPAPHSPICLWHTKQAEGELQRQTSDAKRLHLTLFSFEADWHWPLICVPWVKKKFSCKHCIQLLFTVWMARSTRHSIRSSMPQKSIVSKSAAELARRPGFPITLINSFRIDQTVRKPIEQMRFIRMCPLACFQQDNVRWGSRTDYTDTNENDQNESFVKNKHKKNGHRFSIWLSLAGQNHLHPRTYSTLTVRHLRVSPESLFGNERLPSQSRGALLDSDSQWEREDSLKTHHSTQTGVWGHTLLGVREWQQM